MIEDDVLPTPGELGEEFEQMMISDDEAMKYIIQYAPEIYKRLPQDTIIEFINEYGCPDAIDEFNLIEDEFTNSLFSAYKSQDKLSYDEFLQELVTDYFDI